MGEDPVVEAIRRDIEELLAAKKAGQLTSIEVSNPGSPGMMEEIQGWLDRAAGQSQVDINRVPVRSTRPFWGPLITIYKRLVRKSTYWLYQPLFGQIATFHSTLLEASARLGGWLEETRNHARTQSGTIASELEQFRTSVFAHKAEVENRVAETRGVVASLMDEQAQLKGAVASLMDEQARLKGAVASQVDEQAQLKGAVASLMDEQAQLKDGVSELQQCVASIAGDRTGLQREILEVTRAQAGNVLQELTSLRSQVEDYRTETAFLRAKMALAVQRLATSRLHVTTEVGLPKAAEVADAELQDEAWLYHAFEQYFRGPETLIRERQRAYLPDVQKAHAACRGSVLDVGAGRGEFLELCREAGIPAEGVDLNDAMVARCREKGLEVSRACGLSHLRSLPDESLCAVTAFQVVEHLRPAQLWQMVQAALVKIRPGGLLILETVNPHSLASLMDFYLDLTHERPVPAPTLRFLVEAAGFREVQVRFSSPCPEEGSLQGEEDSVKRLNVLLFGPQDYAVMGWR
ncbi:MAG: methyltransferase domain-containing protein [Firmicutes bacterium]|nr:methyltransferase domain-containing protein [Bacillota bacterium]